MKTALQINNLRKSYKKADFQLENVSLKIPNGSIMGFVGKNGAGKSTTINAVLNIVQKDSGEVTIFGQTMTDDNRMIRNDIGVVFDTLHFSGELTPKKLEKVCRDVYENWQKDTFFTYLERFQLPVNKKIKTFSRGMTMKLSISVALSHKAKLLILDEATAGLDPVAREELLDVLLEFVEEEDHSILMSSHVSSDLEKAADYITFIDQGKIILTEEKDTLLYQYGIARMKQSDFEKLDASEYLAARKRGLQLEVLVQNKGQFSREYPGIVVDNATIDEILPLLTQEDA